MVGAVLHEKMVSHITSQKNGFVNGHFSKTINKNVQITEIKNRKL